MQAREKFSVTMPPDLATDLRATVEAGEYASTSEAIQDAVRLWQRHRLEHAERLEAIRARIQKSVDDPRPNLTLEQVDSELAALFARAERASNDETSRS